MEKVIEMISKFAKKRKILSKLNFVMLYGSQLKGKSTPQSDIDLCLSLSLNKKERDNFRLELCSALPEKYDLHIFEDLPSYVQIEVLKGKLLYIKDRKSLVERALVIIREFEDFERIYNYYLSRNRAGVSL